jgi:hypothetical protein
MYSDGSNPFRLGIGAIPPLTTILATEQRTRRIQAALSTGEADQGRNTVKHG